MTEKWRHVLKQKAVESPRSSFTMTRNRDDDKNNIAPAENQSTEGRRTQTAAEHV